MTDTDFYPATVRGPLKTTMSGTTTFARLFTFDGRFFIAESSNRGTSIRSVTEYEMPQGTPERNVRVSRGATWGPWSYDSCGCASAWKKHKLADLAAMATPLDAPEVASRPAGEIDDDLIASEG